MPILYVSEADIDGLMLVDAVEKVYRNTRAALVTKFQREARRMTTTVRCPGCKATNTIAPATDPTFICPKCLRSYGMQWLRLHGHVTPTKASREAVFREEWAALIGLWRVWTEASDRSIKSNARKQLAAKCRFYALATPETLLAVAVTDPLAVFDRLAPKVLLAPPPDPRFGPAVTASSADELDAIVAANRASVIAKGGDIASGYLVTIDASKFGAKARYTEPTIT